MPGPQPDKETLTRNWNELLQELRVAQTGVQILTGFLLTLPFTGRFADLDETQRYTYLAVLSGSVLATGLLVAPVAFHRVLFRQRQRLWLVETANRTARLGLVMLGLTVGGMMFLVFDIVAGRTPAVVAGVSTLIFLSALWGGLPWLVRGGAAGSREGGDDEPPGSPGSSGSSGP